MPINTPIIPVIICGGAGTRLWPMSRTSRPKPFMELPDGSTLLRHTYQRAAAIAPDGPILTITNRDYYFLCRDEFDAADIADERGHFLLEPVGRNTAPAITLGAHWVQQRFGPESIILVLAADHLIAPVELFSEAVNRAICLAHENWLVTFGVDPEHPETGYGYIECGYPLGDNTYQVARFVEKPDLDRARKFVADGRFLWNSGIFAFRASQFLYSLNTLAPEISAGAINCWQQTQAVCPTEPILLDKASFSSLPNISIDYAVMEKADRVAVVRSGFSWNDIGSWLSASTLIEPDAHGNRISGETALVDSHNTFIMADNRLVAAIGVHDLLIVDTPDALLVAHRDRAQDVKQVVGLLESLAHPASHHHLTTHRPWGSYTVLEEGDRFKMKRLLVKPGKSLSLQMHQHRSEHWVVVGGEAEVINGEQSLCLHANESTYIPAGQKHRLSNPGNEWLVVIEVQTGHYLGEDDIVRFHDHFGRD